MDFEPFKLILPRYLNGIFDWDR